MRKQSRLAAWGVAAMLGVGSLLTQLGGPIPAFANEDRTDSATYTASRADYWAARAAYAARKAAREAARVTGEPLPDDTLAPAPEGGTAAEAPAAVTVAASAPADGVPANWQLAALRMCESSDDYGANTGNGYYGAYQFSPVTWWWLGYLGYPQNASPAVQDAAVRDLYAIFGWSPWPACSYSLGFR